MRDALCRTGQQEKRVWVGVIHAHTLAIKETEGYQTPTATSYCASRTPQMTDSCTAIHMLTVQKDKSVIICGRDLEPNSADLALSPINPLVKTIKCHSCE